MLRAPIRYLAIRPELTIAKKPRLLCGLRMPEEDAFIGIK